MIHKNNQYHKKPERQDLFHQQKSENHDYKPEIQYSC